MSIENKLEQAVVHLIDKSIAGIDTAVDFLSAEIPVYIEQLLTWYALAGIVKVLIGVTFTVIGVVMWRKVVIGYNQLKALSDAEQHEHPNSWFSRGSFGEAEPTLKSIICFVLGAIFLFGGVIGILDCIMEPIKIMVAPHVWLVEYATELKAIASN
ncbi:hypothetical protein ABMA68_16515 [Halobacteriovorax sp. FRX-2]|uniref:hypothetical protein n=1 Tax=Halobacteriovorax sp. FRX-2 TaxID=3157711 RepID=UPI00371B22E3